VDSRPEEGGAMNDNNESPVRPGRYRHYKGRDYEVIIEAKHSETGEMFVIYRSLYGERNVWARPKAMFCETVDVEGTRVKRFVEMD
jgi:hypothetical protein